MLETAYVRFRGALPDTASAHAAADGFSQVGLRIVPFHDTDEIMTLPDVGQAGIVCGQLRDVWAALRRLGRSRPPEISYPEHLDWLLAREIREAAIEDVRRGERAVFVKPVAAKLFTGLVWDPKDARSRLVLAPYAYETPVLVSDVVDFVSEWRCFVCRDEVVGARHYRGAWDRAPDRATLDRAVELGRGRMPAAHALDLGVTADGRTLLVEANDGYALGHYGLPSIAYARFLEARWEQLVGGESGER